MPGWVCHYSGQVAHRWHTLTVGINGPATEVRLFTRGWNTTTKGRVLFDGPAAESVMRAYARHGVDVTIDLEHLSLDPDAPNYDPDARGSGKLALRDGELWLVGIAWTPEAEQRLTERRQRFVSPAFLMDKSQRVTRVHNVAICAQPATDHAMPLIAAGANTMDPKLIMEALDALEAGDAAKALEILKALIASAAGAEGEAPPPAEGEAMADDPMPPEEEEMLSARTSAIASGARIAAAAKRITGKTSASEVEAVLTALSATRSSATDMAGELATLRASVLRGELRELIRANPTKIATPKLEALVLDSDSVDSARALVDALPAVVASAVQQPARESQQSEAIRLTDEDREVCRLTGTPEAALLKFKQAKAAQR